MQWRISPTTQMISGRSRCAPRRGTLAWYVWFLIIVSLALHLHHSLLLTWLRLQGVSHKGYVSKPPDPEERDANRLHGEEVKKRKDAAKEAAARKKERKERHDKECKIAHAKGRPRPARPESTEEEEDSSDVELNFSDDDEVAMGTDSQPFYSRADGGGSSVALSEARLTPGSLMEPPPVRTE